MPKRIYPLELHTFVAEHAAGTNDRDLTELINERFGAGYMTEPQVKAYRSNHHLPSGLPKGQGTYFSKTFPEPIVRYIMANHVGIGPTEMTDKLNEEFGTGYTASQLNGYYRNHHLNSGLTGRFEKGHVPANKGKHPPTVGRMAETQFKKGHLPHNTKPIGYERINKDGYVEVKVKMRPSSPLCNDNFAPKHRLIWEAVNGPIPKGHKLIFADGDKTNITLDNECHYDKHRRRLYIFRELHQVRLKNRKAAELIKPMAGSRRITCDSAEPKSIDEMRDFGLNVAGAKKGPDSVEYGIKWLQDLEEIIIDPVRCPETAREFSGYELDRDKDGNFKAGFPDHDNHHIDAIRYACEDDMKRPSISILR